MELTPKLDESSKIPLYLQLYSYIRTEIQTGRIPSSARLPSIRRLADYLDIAKNTVEASYQQLLAEGYLESRMRSGYYVVPLEKGIWEGETKAIPSEEKSRKPSSESRSCTYNFYNLQIDLASFPYHIWRKLSNSCIHPEESDTLRYGELQGELELRMEIAAYLHRARGVVCTADQIVIGAGTQQLIVSLCVLFGLHGQAIAFEEPGYHGVRDVFYNFGFDIKPIRLEADGLCVNELKRSGAKYVFVTPSHQSPYGIVMPIAKRLKLLQWAEEMDGVVIEDDYNGEFRYIGRPIPSLQGLDPNGRVIYMGTFSKALIPAIRISYMVLPHSLLEVYREKFRSTYADQSASKIHQKTLQMFMSQGYWERHVRKMRNVYHKKYVHLMQAINVFMGDRVRVLGQEAGTHIVLEVRTDHTTDRLLQLAEEAGIKLMSTKEYWFRPEDCPRPQFLLGFGGLSTDEIREGIACLSNVWFQDDEKRGK